MDTNANLYLPHCIGLGLAALALILGQSSLVLPIALAVVWWDGVWMALAWRHQARLHAVQVASNFRQEGLVEQAQT